MFFLCESILFGLANYRVDIRTHKRRGYQDLLCFGVIRGQVRGEYTVDLSVSERVKRGGGQVSQALDELSEIFPASDNVEQELEQRELMTAVTAFLKALPEPQRNLFICRYWQAASIEGLAEQFGMTEGHVKVTLSRLRKKLQKYLGEEGLL